MRHMGWEERQSRCSSQGRSCDFSILRGHSSLNSYICRIIHCGRASAGAAHLSKAFVWTFSGDWLLFLGPLAQQTGDSYFFPSCVYCLNLLIFGRRFPRRM